VGREQHSGSTDAALRRAVFDERLLKGRQPSAISQSLDRGDLASLNLTYSDQATIHHLAVDQHRARTALALTASFFRPGRTQIFAQHIEQAPRA